LVKPSLNGFIIWQTILGLSIDIADILLEKQITIEEEKPQTAPETQKNYFVRW
jgi:hypothetical protein